MMCCPVLFVPNKTGQHIIFIVCILHSAVKDPTVINVSANSDFAFNGPSFEDYKKLLASTIRTTAPSFKVIEELGGNALLDTKAIQNPSEY